MVVFVYKETLKIFGIRPCFGCFSLEVRIRFQREIHKIHTQLQEEAPVEVGQWPVVPDSIEGGLPREIIVLGSGSAIFILVFCSYVQLAFVV